MKNNKSMLFSLLMMLSLSTHIHGSSSVNVTDEGFISIKLTEADKQALENINLELIEASKQGNFSNIQKAILQGADVTYQDETGNTANHHITQAISQKSSLSFGEILEYGITKSRLYDNGASDRIANNEGLTVKDINNNAIQSAAQQRKEITRS